jgi:LmbE family N-acetylglucosaminyl deacetylase/glycosyltransferase involved in cell wall biosynthesis
MEHLLVPIEAVDRVGPGPVLVLAPHPDDEVFGCGGAIIRHVEDGIPVHVIIVSDGGYRREEQTADQRQAYVESRQRESVAAAAVLGYGKPEFWGIRDRGLIYGERLVRDICAAIHRNSAQLVYAPSLSEIHPDHRALAMIAAEAVRRCAGDRVLLAMYEVGNPLSPNRLLDITLIAPKKAQAAGCFKSQLTEQDYTQQALALNRFRSYNLSKNVTSAEAYYVVSAEELRKDFLRIYRSEFQRQRDLGLLTDPAEAPTVTVIIRSIGRDVSLKAALDSVALQTYPKVDVLVVNALGPDHPELGAWCGQFPLRLSGPGHPMNRVEAANFGLEEATGDYLIFLDDDDLFEPDHLSGLVSALETRPDAALAYAGVQCVKKGVDGTWKDFITYNDDFDPIRLLCTNYIPMMAALFRRRIVEAGCRFDPSLKLCEDWDFWLQALAHTEFVHVDRVSARYRISDASSEIWTDKALAENATREVFAKWRSAVTEERMFEIFSRAGRVSTAEQEVRKLQTAYDDRTEHLEHLELAYSERERQTEALRSAYEARTEQVNRLEEAYKARGAQIDHLTKEYERRGEQIAKFQANFWNRLNKRLGRSSQEGPG